MMKAGDIVRLLLDGEEVVVQILAVKPQEPVEVEDVTQAEDVTERLF